jgi:hypothetical protein
MVARDGLPAAAAQGVAAEALHGRLTGVTVVIARDGDAVVVVISGDAPGILRGTSREVSVRAVVPTEGWVPL